MKTYLTVWNNSNGEKPSTVIQKLEGLGFKPLQGNYDFVYDWGQKVDLREIIGISDRVQQQLKGSNVYFNVETL